MARVNGKTGDRLSRIITKHCRFTDNGKYLILAGQVNSGVVMSWGGRGEEGRVEGVYRLSALSVQVCFEPLTVLKRLLKYTN